MNISDVINIDTWEYEIFYFESLHLFAEIIYRHGR